MDGPRERGQARAGPPHGSGPRPRVRARWPSGRGGRSVLRSARRACDGWARSRWHPTMRRRRDGDHVGAPSVCGGLGNRLPRLDERCRVGGEHLLLDHVRPPPSRGTSRHRALAPRRDRGGGRPIPELPPAPRTRALDQKPPTGFKRNFVVESKGDHAGRLDIKHGGVTLIANLARLYAIRAGRPEMGTLERLEAAEETGQITHEQRLALEEAFRLLWQIRLEHQVRQVRARCGTRRLRRPGGAGADRTARPEGGLPDHPGRATGTRDPESVSATESPASFFGIQAG